MRYKAMIEHHQTYRKAMLYAIDGGVYLFLFDTTDNAPCRADEWYETMEDAQYAALERYGIKQNEWVVIPDPRAGQQHDLEYPPEVTP